MSLDTGSSMTWLYSSLVPTSHRHGRNTYDPKANVLFCDHKNGIRYGDALEVRIDGAYLEELRFGETTQRDQIVFRACSVVGQNDISQSILMEGILALRPRHDANSTSITVWAKLAADLPEPVFVADLKFNDRGRYTFGEIPYKETDINFWNGSGRTKDFWKLPITSYAIGGLENSMIKRAEKTDFEAMVDTACSSLRLPSCIVQSYYAKVPGHIEQGGRHLFPSHVMLPDLFLYIGKEHYEVRISGKLLKPQGLLGKEPLSLSRLEEITDPHGPILGHPFFFAQNVIFKGVDVLSVGLIQKSVA